MKIVIVWSKGDQVTGIVSSENHCERDINLISSLIDPDCLYTTSILRAYYHDVPIHDDWKKEFEEEVMWTFYGIEAHELDLLCEKSCIDLFEEYESKNTSQNELSWIEIQYALEHFRRVKAREMLDSILDEIPENPAEPESMLFTLIEVIKEELDSRLPF